MLVFVTDSAQPQEHTLAIAQALDGQPRRLIVFRDKRPRFDRALVERLAELPTPLLINLGAPTRSAQLAAELCALGWHATEACWRQLAAEPSLELAMPWGLSCHDGSGVRFATERGVAMALVSPIFFDKHHRARGPEAFAAPAPGVLRIGLGGITHAAQAQELAEAGADGVALQRALYQAADPDRLARSLECHFAGFSAKVSV